MPVTAGISRRIRDAVIEILQGIQYGGESAFVQVTGSTKGEFDGFPSVRVLPSNRSSAELDSADRDHAVELAAIMHFELSLPDDPNDPIDVDQETFDQMLDLTDLIVDTLEQADQDGRLSTIDPQIQNWLMSSPTARWYVGQGKAGALLLCNIVIRVSYSQFVA